MNIKLEIPIRIGYQHHTTIEAGDIPASDPAARSCPACGDIPLPTDENISSIDAILSLATPNLSPSSLAIGPIAMIDTAVS